VSHRARTPEERSDFDSQDGPLIPLGAPLAVPTAAEQITEASARHAALDPVVDRFGELRLFRHLLDQQQAGLHILAGGTLADLVRQRNVQATFK
jgi:hypothetical protein